MSVCCLPFFPGHGPEQRLEHELLPAHQPGAAHGGAQRGQGPQPGVVRTDRRTISMMLHPTNDNPHKIMAHTPSLPRGTLGMCAFHILSLSEGTFNERSLLFCLSRFWVLLGGGTHHPVRVNSMEGTLIECTLVEQTWVYHNLVGIFSMLFKSHLCLRGIHTAFLSSVRAIGTKCQFLWGVERRKKWSSSYYSVIKKRARGL